MSFTLNPASGGIDTSTLAPPQGWTPYDFPATAVFGGPDLLLDGDDATYVNTRGIYNAETGGAGGDQVLTLIESLSGDDPIVSTLMWHVRYRLTISGDPSSLVRSVAVVGTVGGASLVASNAAPVPTDGGPFVTESGTFDSTTGGDSAIIASLRAGVHMDFSAGLGTHDTAAVVAADFFISEMWLTYETAASLVTEIPKRRLLQRNDGRRLLGVSSRQQSRRQIGGYT